MPIAEAERARADDQLRPEPAVERPGDEGGEGEDAHHRQEPGAGADRRIAELLGHELGQEDQRREEDRRDQQRRRAGRRELPVAEHVGRHQRRRADPPLDEGEGDEPDRAEREQAEDQRVGPAAVRPLVEGEEQRQDADRERGDAGIVDPLPGAVRLVLADDPEGDQHGEGRDRQVEEEDPAPADRVGEDAADQRPDRVADAGRAEDDAAGQSGPRRGEERIGHAEDRRPHHRAADAHQRTAPRAARRCSARSRRSPRRAAKIAAPSMNTVRRPNMSASRPPVTISTPNTMA